MNERVQAEAATDSNLVGSPLSKFQSELYSYKPLRCSAYGYFT